MARKGIFRRILVAVDGSENSMAAVDKAVQMAARDNAELIAMNVLQMPVVHHFTPAVISAALEKGTTEADEWFADVKRLAEESGAKIKTQMVKSLGSPASEIVSYAEKENVDLIVMGTKGRSKLKKILFGSVATGVVMNAPCTVMVVR